MQAQVRLCLTLLIVLVGVLMPRAAALAGDCQVKVLISALHYDSALTGEPDEALELYNPNPAGVSLEGWTLTDGEYQVRFPAFSLGPRARAWVARQAASFAGQFGFPPALEYGADTDPAVPNTTGTAPVFANTGDEVVLTDSCGNISDAVVYKAGDASSPGWVGPSVQPYVVGDLSETAQILYRRLDLATGLPLADSDTAADWAQFRGDPLLTRKVRYPGWDLENHLVPHRVTELAGLTVAVAPDASYAVVEDAIRGATQLVLIGVYTLEHPRLVRALTERLAAGVRVRVLLEGAPVGGISSAERWACRELEAAGGECWFMTSIPDRGRRRYPSMHAKYAVIDGLKAVISTENFGPSGLPADDFSDGTAGNRGAILVTTAPGIVDQLLRLFAADLDPARPDVRRWNSATDSPPPDFRPGPGGGTGYTPAFTTPLNLTGAFDFELIRSPENSLNPNAGLFRLLGRAGSGWEVLVQALYEPPFWGGSGASPKTDPNPRLESMLAAARRGARVRILLDGLYGNTPDPTSNRATCDYVTRVARAEGLDLACRLANPAGLGIHSKLVLVGAGAEGWVHLGSINGSEVSSKANREVAVQFGSRAAFDYLAAVFWTDWDSGGRFAGRVWLPFISLR